MGLRCVDGIHISQFDYYFSKYFQDVPALDIYNCVKHLPMVSHLDCTQVDITNLIKFMFDQITNSLTGKITSIVIKYMSIKELKTGTMILQHMLPIYIFKAIFLQSILGNFKRIVADQSCKRAIDFKHDQQRRTCRFDHNYSVRSKVAGRVILKSKYT